MQGDPQPSVRAAVTRALWMVIFVSAVPAGEIDVAPAMNGLADRLDDSDPAVRLAAVQGLGMLGPNLLGDPPPRLVAAMKDESNTIRDAAVRAMDEFRKCPCRLSRCCGVGTTQR
jgi:HEAT repeat protein